MAYGIQLPTSYASFSWIYFLTSSRILESGICSLRSGLISLNRTTFFLVFPQSAPLNSKYRRAWIIVITSTAMTSHALFITFMVVLAALVPILTISWLSLLLGIL